LTAILVQDRGLTWPPAAAPTAADVSLEATRIDDGTAHPLEAGEVDLALGLVPWLESGLHQQALD